MNADQFEGSGRPADIIAPTNPIEQALEYFQEGRMYEAVGSWFKAPTETRDDFLANSILQASELNDSLRGLKRNRSLAPQLQFALKNFTLLSSPGVEKIFDPQVELTDKDLDVLRSDMESERATNKFSDLGSRVGVETLEGNLNADESEFATPQAIFHKSFSTEDVAILLRTLGPRVKPSIIEGTHESVPIHWNTFVSGKRHTDLLLDDTVRKYVENILTKDERPETYFGSYLIDNLFPKPAFFTEFFKLHPELSDPNSMIERFQQAPLPESLYFYTMLRKIRNVGIVESYSASQKDNVCENVFNYLMSDEIMQRALPYLDLEELYGAPGSDDLASDSGDGRIRYRDKIIATGQVAKETKKERLGEVLRLAVQYIEKKDRKNDVEQLKARKVNGIKFADFLPEVT